MAAIRPLTSAIVSYVSNLTGGISRTALLKLQESPSIQDFGAVGDGTTNNDAAFVKTEASEATRLYVPPGTYITTRPVENFTKVYYGPGSIIANGVKLAKFISNITSAYTVTPSNIGDPANMWNGDFSKTPITIHRTFSAPQYSTMNAGGYYAAYENASVAIQMHLKHGTNYMSNLATSAQSAVGGVMVNAIHDSGGGGAMCFQGNVEMTRSSEQFTGTEAGRWWQASGTVFTGQVLTWVKDVFLNIAEWLCIDGAAGSGGNDCSAIGLVLRFSRRSRVVNTVHRWYGLLISNIEAGSEAQPLDIGIRMDGKVDWGISFTNTTVGIGAIALAANQKVFFNAVESTSVLSGNVSIGYNTTDSSLEFNTSASSTAFKIDVAENAYMKWDKYLYFGAIDTNFSGSIGWESAKGALKLTSGIKGDVLGHGSAYVDYFGNLWSGRTVVVASPANITFASEAAAAAALGPNGTELIPVGGMYIDSNGYVKVRRT